MIVIGRVRMVKIGRIVRLKSPQISAAITAVEKLFTSIPGTKFAIRSRVAAVAST